MPERALELQQVAREVFERELPADRAKALREDGGTGHSPALWRTLADLGWLGLPFAQEHGGSGGDFVDVAVVFEEAGRCLVPTTLRTTLFAGLLVDRLGTEAQKGDHLAAISSGQMIATVAIAEPGRTDIDEVRTVARRSEDGWRLQGVKSLVENATSADFACVLARTRGKGQDSDLRLLMLPCSDPGVEIVPHSAFGGPSLATVTLHDCSIPVGSALGDRTDAVRLTQAVADASSITSAMQAMSMVGGTTRVLEQVVGYVKQRRQYSREIGAFQAVQHRLADCRTSLDAARLAALQAVWAIDNSRHSTRASAVAKLCAGRAFKEATLAAHQFLGGMGYMKESDLYLWTERAKREELLHAGPRNNVRTIVDGLRSHGARLR